MTELVNNGKVQSGARVLLIIAGVIIVALGMRAAADIINSIALALILAISMTPILNWLVKRGLPRGAALIVVTILVVLVVLLLTVIIVVSLQNVADTLPTYKDQIQGLEDDVVSTMDDFGVDISDVRNSETLSSENIVSKGVSAASVLVGALTSWLLMLVLVAYMLMESLDFPAKIKKSLSAGSPVPPQLTKLSESLRSYISLTVWLSALNAIIMTVIMFIVGVDFALLWGILAFVMGFIPYVGFVIALVPPTVFALLEGGWVEALIILAAFLIVNTVIDNVMKPKMMGKGLDLSPLVIMLSLFVWAWVLGPMGALLAVPMTIIVKQLMFEMSDDTRWLSNLMMPLDAIKSPSDEEIKAES